MKTENVFEQNGPSLNEVLSKALIRYYNEHYHDLNKGDYDNRE